MRKSKPKVVAVDTWLQESCGTSDETNAQRLNREHNLMITRDSTESIRRNIVIAKWGFMLPILDRKRKVMPFCRGVADNIRRGIEPKGSALTVCGEMYARSTGGKVRTPKYIKAFERFVSLIK